MEQGIEREWKAGQWHRCDDLSYATARAGQLSVCPAKRWQYTHVCSRRQRRSLLLGVSSACELPDTACCAACRLASCISLGTPRAPRRSHGTFGELGYGVSTTLNVPIVVSGGRRFAAICVGAAVSAGIEQGSGLGLFWGMQGGTKGNPDVVPTPTPVGNQTWAALEPTDTSRMYGLLSTPSLPPPMLPGAAGAPEAAPGPADVATAAAETTSPSTPTGAIIGGVVGGLGERACWSLWRLGVVCSACPQPALGAARSACSACHQPARTPPPPCAVALVALGLLALRWRRRRRASGAARPASADEEKQSDGKLWSSLSGKPGRASERLSSDPVLSVIAASLSRAAPPASSAESSTPDAASGGELQQWLVQWEDIQFERLLGRGSFGRVSGCLLPGRGRQRPVVCCSPGGMPARCRKRWPEPCPAPPRHSSAGAPRSWPLTQVYLARWFETPCAVKVLLTTGALEGRAGRPARGVASGPAGQAGGRRRRG